MDPVAFSPALANRRLRNKFAVAATIVPPSALTKNPVELVVVDADGEYAISAERGKNGKVWLTCQCAASHADGWCQHRVDLICGRYDGAPKANAETRRAFGQIIGGTSLQSAGQDADRALNAFAQCLTAFDARRPVRVIGRDLGKFTDLVSDLAACASELEDALGTLRRLLERT